MACLCTTTYSGLLSLMSSRCVILAILLGKSHVRVFAAVAYYRVEGRDATHDATHHSSIDHATLPLIRREVDVKRKSRSSADAVESDRAHMTDARAPLQASNRGTWWFWPEPEPQPSPAPAPASFPAPFVTPGAEARIDPSPSIEKRLNIPSWPQWKPFVDRTHIDETATAGERAFFESLEAEIKRTWFLHGQPLVIMIAKRPYLVSPDRNLPVKTPHMLAEELAQGEDYATPESVARRAYTKNVAELAMWVPDVTALKTLVRDFSVETMVSLQQERKLRGFWKGEEHSSRHVDMMKSSDFVKLGLSTMWLRGGLGRESLMKKALLSTPSSF